MLFLSGRGKELRETLEKEMRQAAKEERFEDARDRHRELFALDHIQDVSLIKDESLEDSRRGQGSTRIEAYDTAHLSGTNAIGVMTVIIRGIPSKKDYRTFRIHGIKNNVGRTTSYIQNDDIASLKEVLSRRFGHPEWQLPSAIVVDGGTTHKKAAESVLVETGISIPVVAVVKDERHRPREVIGAQRANITEAEAVLANSEAHRFSLARHRAARSRNMRTK
jgi:excinuclease ABC subunit C